MTHPELTKVLLGAHAAVLLVAMTAYYKYGDRTETFKNSFQGTEDVIEHMRRKIAIGLAEKLKPVFSADPKSVITSILDQTCTPYSEIIISPAGGEEYKDALFDYVENAPEVLIDYRSLILARNALCKWAKRLSSSILFLVIWQAIMVLICFLESIEQVVLPDIAIKFSTYATAFFGATCLFGLIPILYSHNAIIEYRRKYHVL
jgi:hypothetical protein